MGGSAFILEQMEALNMQRDSEVEGTSRDGGRGGGSAFILEQTDTMNMQRDTEV